MLQAVDISLGLDSRQLFDKINIMVQAAKIMTIIGPNGSGKSTLLKVLTNGLKPDSGSVYLDGKTIYSYSGRALACQMAVLSQTPQSPGDLTVRDLVEYGRFPHQSWWKNTAGEDRAEVEWALKQTNLSAMGSRLLSTLSGGERQRAWLALALAQKPRIMLLDEPTTYLDISHQLEVLELIRDLNRRQDITVVMVLHDINHAARYSDTLAVMNAGQVYAVGSPAEVINAPMLHDVFSVEADIWTNEEGYPVCMPKRLVKK